VALEDDPGLQFGNPGNSRIEVIDFEPEQYTIAVGFVSGIADREVVVFDLKAVQLEDQQPVRDQPLVFRTPVHALTAQKMLVPAAARIDIGDCDEGLRAHPNLGRGIRWWLGVWR
jgi:hypothetical protein